MNKHESLYSRGFWSNIESFPAGGFFHGNTLDHHDQIAPKNTASLAGRMDAGKGKAAAFQALVVQHEPAPFPMEQLDGRPGPVDKDHGLIEAIQYAYDRRLTLHPLLLLYNVVQSCFLFCLPCA